MRAIFTPICFTRFNKTIELIRSYSKKTSSMKAEGANDGDGWHSELFKFGIGVEIMEQTRLQEILNIKRNARVISPPDQTDRVALGSGVNVIRNGKPEQLFMGGYRIDNAPRTHINIQSPLGKVLLGAKKGESRTLQIKDKIIVIKIINLIPYSQMEEFLQ